VGAWIRYSGFVFPPLRESRTQRYRVLLMNYVFEPSMPVAVPVAGDERQFPVRRVYCVGRNYAAHAREMGSDPDREPPFFFCKPGDAVVPVPEGETLSLQYPPQTRDFHYEIELVAA